MLKSLKQNKPWSGLSVVFIAFVSLLFSKFFVNWGASEHPYEMDVAQYYSYLIHIFVDQDPLFTQNPHGYWLVETPIHHWVPMVTYGMSLLYSPFFLIARLFSPENSTGYEPIYAWSIHLGMIIYVLLGLWYARKTLLLWKNEHTSGMSIFVIFFGSNLFCYTLINSEMTHGPLFFLSSIYFYHVCQWQRTQKVKYVFIFSFLLGLITLIRPTEFSQIVFPILIGLGGSDTFKKKAQSIVQLKWNLLLSILLFLIPIIPQLWFWKMQSGQWFFFSYGKNERFFWTDPQLINVLFSYRKGWLVYSPLMILSLFGFVFLYQKNKILFWPIMGYFVVNIYLISSWWDWAYGGAFGLRALVQTYAFLIIPLAYFIEWAYHHKKHQWMRISFTMILIFFCFLNIFQSNLYKHGIIHYDGMTKEAYWYTFLKKKLHHRRVKPPENIN